MPSNVTRDGDTVRLRDRSRPREYLQICDVGKYGVYLVMEDKDGRTAIVTNEPDFIALCYTGLALAGQPDWRAIAVKLGRLATLERSMRKRREFGVDPNFLLDQYSQACAAITDDEWALLEGADDAR